jgi:hypothetical protein
MSQNWIRRPTLPSTCYEGQATPTNGDTIGGGLYEDLVWKSYGKAVSRRKESTARTYTGLSTS